MLRLKYLKSGELSEESIQKSVIDWVRLIPALNKLVIHIPNEGRRTPRFGALLKRMGMRPGTSDLFIAMGKHDYHGAWIELKSKNGVLSEEQKDFLETMRSQNYFVAVCWSIDEAIKTISWYCFD